MNFRERMCGLSKRTLLLLPLPAAGATPASAAIPDVAALVTSPWGAWTAFALAITLVIVLLLWYVVADEPAETQRRPDAARRHLPSRQGDAKRRRARVRRADAA